MAIDIERMRHDWEERRQYLLALNQARGESVRVAELVRVMDEQNREIFDVLAALDRRLGALERGPGK